MSKLRVEKIEGKTGVSSPVQVESSAFEITAPSVSINGVIINDTTLVNQQSNGVSIPLVAGKAIKFFVEINNGVTGGYFSEIIVVKGDGVDVHTSNSYSSDTFVGVNPHTSSVVTSDSTSVTLTVSGTGTITVRYNRFS